MSCLDSIYLNSRVCHYEAIFIVLIIEREVIHDSPTEFVAAFYSSEA